jgi:predicted GIY-YIG superfamily endonuclease
MFTNCSGRRIRCVSCSRSSDAAGLQQLSKWIRTENSARVRRSTVEQPRRPSGVDCQSSASRLQTIPRVGSSMVEQRPFKALVVGSSPTQPKPKPKPMAWVYILKGSSGRHYIGSTDNLERRIREHQNGGTHTTQRLGDRLELIATKELASVSQARALERQLKRKKNPSLAIRDLRSL